MGTVVLRITEKLKATQLDMDKLVREVANNFYVENQQRVNNEGKDVKGALIGQGKYSTEKSLATKDQFTKTSAFKVTMVESEVYKRNKKGKVVYKPYSEDDGSKAYIPQKKKVKRELWIKFKKAKKAVPVMVLEQGYKELRDIQGKTTSHVNLQYTGTLKTKFIIQNENGKYKIGFDGDYGKKVSGYMEDKYNQKIWGISEEGKTQAQAIVKRYIDQHLKK